MSVFPKIGVPSAALLLLSVSLGGCMTSGTNASLMDAHAEAPRPTSRAYLPVEEMPADRKTPALTVDEQTKLKRDLAAARDRQAAAAKAQN